MGLIRGAVEINAVTKGPAWECVSEREVSDIIARIVVRVSCAVVFLEPAIRQQVRRNQRGDGMLRARKQAEQQHAPDVPNA